VKEMAKIMTLWRYNLNAPWPIDPAEGEKLNEMMFAAIDDWLKTGEMLEFGFFPDGMGGYAISGDSKDVLKQSMSIGPFILVEPHEIVPYETGREIMKGLFKAQAEAAEAMKQ
jgi:hypothetical protein